MVHKYTITDILYALSNMNMNLYILTRSYTTRFRQLLQTIVFSILPIMRGTEIRRPEHEVDIYSYLIFLRI